MRAALALWVIAAITNSSAADAGLSAIIDQVLTQGPTNRLPAHLSMVLGISGGDRPVSVKQAVLRDAATVRTFNVCTGNHADVVLAVYNEQSRALQAYLIDAAGNLRKAVAYRAGEAPSVRAASEAREDFGRELAFWTRFER